MSLSANEFPTIMVRKVKNDAVSATNLMHGVRTNAPIYKHRKYNDTHAHRKYSDTHVHRKYSDTHAHWK